MKEDVAILERIRNYVRGRMSSDEQEAFEKLLEQQPELQEEVDFAREMVLVGEEAETERLFRLVEEEIKKNPVDQQGRVVRINFRRVLAVAAAILALVVAGYWWLVPKESDFEEFLTEGYIEPDDPTVRGETTYDISRPYREFYFGNYELSISLIDKIPLSDSMYLELLFLKGHNFLQLGNYEESIKILKGIEGLKPSIERYDANFWDHVGWTKIIAYAYRYHNSELTGDLELLNQELEVFINQADPEDIYFKKAENLKILISN